MTVSERLKTLLGKQKELTEDYQSLIKDSSLMADINQVEDLRRLLDEKKKQINTIEMRLSEIRDQNEKLRLTLHEQIMDEKLNILKVSKTKMELYFGKNKTTSENELKQIESDFSEKVERLKRRVTRDLGDKGSDLLKDCATLEIEIQKRLQEYRKQLAKEETALYKEYTASLSHLENHEVNEETVQKRIKQNKIEMKIGQYGLSIVAAIVMIIGIGLTAYYTHSFMSDTVKGVLFFGLGGLFIAVGEFLFYKRKAAFANTMIGVGIAVLFAAVFYSHFMLEIMGMMPALMVSILVTVTALTLAVVNNSKLVIIYGLVGGYIPFLSYGINNGFNDESIYMGMGYMIMLNLLVLIISLVRRWHLTTYVSFFLHLPAMIYLTLEGPNQVVGLIYVAVVFLIYLVDVLAWPLFHKKSLVALDLVLLGLHTTATCLITAYLVDKLGFDKTGQGVATLIFGLIYAGLGYFTSRFLKSEIKTVILFYITVLTFSLLTIPFILGVESLIFAWIIESVLLIIAGYLFKNKMMERGGWVVFWLCLGWFYIIEIILSIQIQNYGDAEYLGKFISFDFKFLSVALGGLAILIVYFRDIANNILSRFSKLGRYINGFKYYVFSALYAFSLYVVFRVVYEIGASDLDVPGAFMAFYLWAALALVTMGMGLFLNSKTIFYDRAFKVSGIIFYMLGSLISLSLVLAINVMDPPGEASMALRIISLIVLTGLTVMAVVSIRSQILKLVRSASVSAEWYPFWMGIIMAVVLSIFVLRQISIDNVSLLLSSVYIVFAILSILYGFWKRYLYIRIVGLILIVLGLIIFLINVFAYGEPLFKIIAAFTFAFLLLGISFVYLKVNKNFTEMIDIKMPEKSDKKSDEKSDIVEGDK